MEYGRSQPELPQNTWNGNMTAAPTEFPGAPTEKPVIGGFPRPNGADYYAQPPAIVEPNVPEITEPTRPVTETRSKPLENGKENAPPRSFQEYITGKDRATFLGARAFSEQQLNNAVNAHIEELPPGSVIFVANLGSGRTQLAQETDRRSVVTSNILDEDGLLGQMSPKNRARTFGEATSANAGDETKAVMHASLIERAERAMQRAAAEQNNGQQEGIIPFVKVRDTLRVMGDRARRDQEFAEAPSLTRAERTHAEQAITAEDAQTNAAAIHEVSRYFDELFDGDTPKNSATQRPAIEAGAADQQRAEKPVKMLHVGVTGDGAERQAAVRLLTTAMRKTIRVGTPHGRPEGLVVIGADQIADPAMHQQIRAVCDDQGIPYLYTLGEVNEETVKQAKGTLVVTPIDTGEAGPLEQAAPTRHGQRISGANDSISGNVGLSDGDSYGYGFTNGGFANSSNTGGSWSHSGGMTYGKTQNVEYGPQSMLPSWATNALTPDQVAVVSGQSGYLFNAETGEYIGEFPPKPETEPELLDTGDRLESIAGSLGEQSMRHQANSAALEQGRKPARTRAESSSERPAIGSGSVTDALSRGYHQKDAKAPEGLPPPNIPPYQWGNQLRGDYLHYHRNMRGFDGHVRQVFDELVEAGQIDESVSFRSWKKARGL